MGGFGEHGVGAPPRRDEKQDADGKRRHGRCGRVRRRTETASRGRERCPSDNLDPDPRRARFRPTFFFSRVLGTEGFAGMYRGLSSSGLAGPFAWLGDSPLYCAKSRIQGQDLRDPRREWNFETKRARRGFVEAIGYILIHKDRVIFHPWNIFKPESIVRHVGGVGQIQRGFSVKREGCRDQRVGTPLENIESRLGVSPPRKSEHPSPVRGASKPRASRHVFQTVPSDLLGRGGTRVRTHTHALDGLPPRAHTLPARLAPAAFSPWSRLSWTPARAYR